MGSFVQCVEVRANAPALHDNTADLDRLKNGVRNRLNDSRPVHVPLPIMNRLARLFREASFTGWALVNELEHCWLLVDFFQHPQDTLPAMALDLGTTHLEASLVDLISGDVLVRDTRENPQIQYGADILSRIHFGTAQRRRLEKVDKDFFDPGLEKMQQAIVDAINTLAGSLVKKVNKSHQDIRGLSVSGNTTMVHLLLGLDPFHICREPYIPLANSIDPPSAHEMNLAIHPMAPVWVMPSVGSYFGGDLISGIVASGMVSRKEITMLIDVGTNAEVVLGNSEWLIGCAGAAGPALEGGVARMGMRAAPGAIDSVSIDPQSFDLHYSTLGDVTAKGICGSGLIDLVASMYLTRIINSRGKFRDPSREKNSRRARFMTSRLIRQGDQQAFVIVPAEIANNKEAVVLEQVDLDAMIRSKAAMYAILTTLVGQVGLGFEDITQICVAGAFGRHINPKSAISLGMLPDLELSTYKPIGNSSLKGAEKVLVDGKARLQCEKIVQTLTYLELNVNQEFMIRFSGSKFIPHTDPTQFPSVPFFDGKE